MSRSSLALQEHFAGLPDPRVRGRSRHLLIDIIAIAICAALYGANDWPAVEIFGKTHRDWFRKFLRLPHGIPAHDTFKRVFERLNRRAFQRYFLSWTRSLAEALGFTNLAIDAKTLRGSADAALPLGPLQLVRAWAMQHRSMLGQATIESKFNATAAGPQILELLELHGAIVPIDAKCSLRPD